MKGEDLKQRTKRLAIEIVRLCRKLPETDEGHIIARQLLRCGTSVGANYRAVCRARSRPDFISKLGIVLEEADETSFWLELLVESGAVPSSAVQHLLAETNELTAIFVASLRSAKNERD
ncbi:MAG TPA: four helix bundle protein [Terriglobales bacterium]|jgi:four helix bundle protein|nr:four helix bundle protein [Terriglobales bacterium]